MRLPSGRVLTASAFGMKKTIDLAPATGYYANAMKNLTKTGRATELELEQHQHHVTTLLEPFYRALVADLLKRPGDLKVVVECCNGTAAVTAEPHPSDAGNLIGGRAQMFHAVRIVLKQFARRHGMEVHYDIQDNKDSKRERGAEFVARKDWPLARVGCYVEVICEYLFEFPARIDWQHGADKSTVRIYLDADEPHHVTCAELKGGLSRVLNATGMALGRVLYVDAVERRRE
jgi:predicted RNA-binding protein YlqC (UPF0109 family)